MGLEKTTIFRLSENLKSLAYQSIISYAIRRNSRPENLSEYLRRLVTEDIHRNREILRQEYKASLNENKIEAINEVI